MSDSLDLSTPPKDFAAFGRGVWSALTNNRTISLSQNHPQAMATLAIKAGLAASRKATIARTMRVQADQAVRLSQGYSDAEARAWATRRALGVEGPDMGPAQWDDEASL